MFGEVINTSQHSNEKISHNTTKPLVTNYNTLQGAKVSLSREVFGPCFPSHHFHDVSCTFIITWKITREP